MYIHPFWEDIKQIVISTGSHLYTVY